MSELLESLFFFFFFLENQALNLALSPLTSVYISSSIFKMTAMVYLHLLTQNLFHFFNTSKSFKII